MKVAAGEEAPYLISKVHPDGHHEAIWSSANIWVIDPTLSPDGTAVAVTGRSVHAEAWRVELDGFCQGE